MVPLAESLKRLESAAARLNEVSDSLNADIIDLEDRLTKIGVGVAIRLGLKLCEKEETNRPHDYSSHYDLGYSKVGGAWRVVAFPCEVDPQYGEVVSSAMPLTDAPRLVRCEALPHLEKLINALLKRCEELTDDVSRARSANRPS